MKWAVILLDFNFIYIYIYIHNTIESALACVVASSICMRNDLSTLYLSLLSLPSRVRQRCSAVGPLAV